MLAQLSGAGICRCTAKCEFSFKIVVQQNMSCFYFHQNQIVVLHLTAFHPVKSHLKAAVITPTAHQLDCILTMNKPEC